MSTGKLSKIERNYLDKLIEDAYNGVVPNEETVKELISKAKEIFIKEENNNNSFINNQESDKDYDVNEDKDKEDSGEEAYYKPGETQLFTREKKK